MTKKTEQIKQEAKEIEVFNKNLEVILEKIQKQAIAIYKMRKLKQPIWELIERRSIEDTIDRLKWFLEIYQ